MQEHGNLEVINLTKINGVKKYEIHFNYMDFLCLQCDWYNAVE